MDILNFVRSEVMKTFNEEKLKKVADFIISHIRSYGEAPSLREICEECKKRKKSTVQNMIAELEKRKIITTERIAKIGTILKTAEKTISTTAAIMITSKIKIITLPTPILEMSFAASKTFKASLKLPVFASLASAIVWKNEKITNKIKATVPVTAKETARLTIA